MSEATSAVRTTVSESERMEGNVRRRPGRFPYPARASVDVREDELLALEWGCKESTAHQRKIRAMADVVTVILVKRRIAAHDSLAGYIRPIENATAAAPQPDALHREKLCDAEEDCLQAEYDRNPSEQTARALLRKRAVMRQASLDHDREVAALYGIVL